MLTREVVVESFRVKVEDAVDCADQEALGKWWGKSQQQGTWIKDNKRWHGKHELLEPNEVNKDETMTHPLLGEG